MIEYDTKCLVSNEKLTVSQTNLLHGVQCTTQKYCSEYITIKGDTSVLVYYAPPPA